MLLYYILLCSCTSFYDCVFYTSIHDVDTNKTLSPSQIHLALYLELYKSFVLTLKELHLQGTKSNLLDILILDREPQLNNSGSVDRLKAYLGKVISLYEYDIESYKSIYGDEQVKEIEAFKDNLVSTLEELTCEAVDRFTGSIDMVKCNTKNEYMILLRNIQRMVRYSIGIIKCSPQITKKVVPNKESLLSSVRAISDECISNHTKMVEYNSYIKSKEILLRQRLTALNINMNSSYELFKKVIKKAMPQIEYKSDFIRVWVENDVIDNIDIRIKTLLCEKTLQFYNECEYRNRLDYINTLCTIVKKNNKYKNHITILREAIESIFFNLIRDTVGRNHITRFCDILDDEFLLLIFKLGFKRSNRLTLCYNKPQDNNCVLRHLFRTDGRNNLNSLLHFYSRTYNKSINKDCDLIFTFLSNVLIRIGDELKGHKLACEARSKLDFRFQSELNPKLFAIYIEDEKCTEDILEKQEDLIQKMYKDIITARGENFYNGILQYFITVSCPQISNSGKYNKEEIDEVCENIYLIVQEHFSNK